MTLPMPRVTAEELILVIDDDRRVRELLEIAFTAHGYRVITAVDGEDGIRKALHERPDLVVLDVRLPKRSGLEVCEALRADPAGGEVPIILVSAAAENETRIVAFARGADDYLVKPFSPRELLARVKRLLARTQALRQARDQIGTIERDLSRVNEESRRSHLAAGRAQQLRDLAFGIGAELHRTRDLDELARRLLRGVQAQIDTPAIVLLLRDGGQLAPWSVRGDLFDRGARLVVPGGGELATFLAGLGRPVYRHALEHLPELEPALRVFAAARMDLLVPIRSEHGLEALIALEEPRGGTPSRAVFESLEALCGLGAIAISNARADRVRAIETVELAFGEPGTARIEAAELLARAAGFVPLAPTAESMVRLGVRIGRAAATPAGAELLRRTIALDATRFVAEFARIVAGAVPAGDAGPEHESANEPAGAGREFAADFTATRELIGLGWQLAEAREQGVGPAQAVARVRSDRASLVHALRRAVDEALEAAPEDVSF